MSRCTLDPAVPRPFSHTGLSPALAGFPKTILLKDTVTSAVRTPGCSHPGLGSSGFARRYSRNRCFFLFLRLLRCFSSPGSLHAAMDSLHGGRSSSGRVSPFRHPRIDGYLLLPVAFRSLSRLSSALSAKASTLRSFLLDHLPDLRSGDHRCFPVASGTPAHLCLLLSLLLFSIESPGLPSREPSCLYRFVWMIFFRCPACFHAWRSF